MRSRSTTGQRRRRAPSTSGSATRVPSDSTEAFVASERPRRIIIMVKAGPDGCRHRRAGRFEDGDIVVDAGNAHFVDTQRRGAGAARARPALRRNGSFRRRGGRAARPEHHAGRFPGVVRGTVPSSRTSPQGGRHALLRLRRSRRGRPFREDGAQRHRVRRHAAHRGGHDLLRSGVDMPVADIAAVFKEWNSGDLESFLIETTATVLTRRRGDWALRRRGA